MRLARYLLIPIVLFALLGCGLTNGLQQIQQAVTQLPGELTSMPTMIGAAGTMAAGSSTGSGTPASGTLGISLTTVRTMLQATQQFSFQEVVGGAQPESVATLTGSLATTMPELAAGFKAEFIGDPTSLSQIKISFPANISQPALMEATQMVGVIFSGILPPNVVSPMVTWMQQVLPQLTSAGQQQQTTIGAFQFTLARSQTTMTFEIDPAGK